MVILSTSKNKTKYLILGLLSEQPLSGYEIKKIVDIRFSFFWNESFGQIYPELKKLEAEGLARMLETLNEDGKQKSSKKFSITQAGQKELEKWLKEPVEKEMVRYELLLKLYFSNSISGSTMLEHIREFQIIHRKQQMIFDKFEEELNRDIDMHENHRAILMVLNFGQKVWKAYDEWCNEVISIIDQNK
ncbi:MAG: PadR family transcriptional regulator [Bacillota bacterium]|nr:PadR family transcriptional regulator [Bacillota bacterium]